MAARSIAKLFDKLGLEYSRTAKSDEPSFTKNFLTNHPHPLVQKIAQARKNKQGAYNFYRFYFKIRTLRKNTC